MRSVGRSRYVSTTMGDVLRRAAFPEPCTAQHLADRLPGLHPDRFQPVGRLTDVVAGCRPASASSRRTTLDRPCGPAIPHPPPGTDLKRCLPARPRVQRSPPTNTHRSHTRPDWRRTQGVVPGAIQLGISAGKEPLPPRFAPITRRPGWQNIGDVALPAITNVLIPAAPVLRRALHTQAPTRRRRMTPSTPDCRPRWSTRSCGLAAT